MMGYGANPSTLCRIDKTTNEVTTFTPGIGVEAYAIAVDKDFLWIAGKGNYTVYKISKADLSIFASVVVPYPVAIALDDKYVWVSEHGPGKLAKLEKATTALLLEIPVGKYPYTLAVDDKYVWLTNVGDSTVSKVNKKTNRVSVIKGFANPYFGISIDRHHVWVANTQTGTVSVIDKNSDVIVSTITGFSGTYMYGDATGYAYYKQRASHN
jgi:DNA-binding beta-propeller fold protein YncE